MIRAANSTLSAVDVAQADAGSRAGSFDAIVIGGSAGGLPAAAAILRNLPADCALPVLLMLHLPIDSLLDQFFARLPFDVGWVEQGSCLAPRKLLLCPPHTFVELLPDGTCTLAPAPGGALDKPIDRLFDSVARSLGPRAIGVVLSGMGRDAAEGAARLHAAGGRVIVQGPSTSEWPAMPDAAIGEGAADLVVPLHDMAQVLGELVAGTPRPRLASEARAIDALFAGPGDARASLREVDWEHTPLGLVVDWPGSLRDAVRMVLASEFPALLRWGRESVQVANDAWLALHAGPPVQGRSASDTAPASFPDLQRDDERVARGGKASWQDDRPCAPMRKGFREEAYFTSSSSPVLDESGACAGILTLAVETTARVLAERRLRTMHGLIEALAGVTNVHEACTAAAKVLAGNPHDLPVAAIYLADKAGANASLAAVTGTDAGSALAPHWVSTNTQGQRAPLERAIATSASFELDNLPDLLAGGEAGAAARGARSARVLPLRPVPDDVPAGVLFVVTSPRLPFDGAYRSFLELVASRVGSVLASIRARERERERLARLAALDNAKTEFFSNVSHEFRTPLALMLPPLEQLVHVRESLPPQVAADVDMAARNARRLLRLVDSLLDFSEIDARRQGAALEPADIGALTRDIASAFRGAIEQAGLSLQLDIDPQLPPVPVNREMWEKVVSNLLSNALKFTFEGSITVRLQALRLHVELEVADTGVGIPKEEQPNVFKRFHRVRGTRARTAEGAGIGLAIVKDLVERLGGQLTLGSTPGRGSRFTVWLPRKSARRQAEPAAGGAGGPSSRIAADLASEAARWLTVDGDTPPGVAEDLLALPLPGAAPAAAPASRPRLLVADDNGDVRDYLRRLFCTDWDVRLAADGSEALAMARDWRPDLILADVMMPGMGGFELLREVRADESLKATPLVVVTAHAGEQSAIDGLLAGADDYIAKPFSPRELTARVRGQLQLARMRRRAAEFNEFLVRLTDAVRARRRPGEIAEVALQLLLRRLGAQRAHWTEVDWSTREYVVVHAAAAPGIQPLQGRWPMEGWEPFSDTLGAGRQLVIEDVQEDPRVPPQAKARLAQRPAGALISVPCMVEGRLQATIGVNFASPRAFSGDEVALVEAVAGRCWAEVERARAEEALRETNERIGKLLALMPAGVYSCDAQGSITYYNRRAAELWGREPQLGPGLESFSGALRMWTLDGRPLPHAESPMAEAVRTRQPARGVELVVEKPGGERIVVNVDIDPVGDARGRSAGTINVFVDVTERKQAEQALRTSGQRADRDLVDMSRLQAIGGMLLENQDDEAVCARIIDAAMALMGSDAASMQLVDGATGDLQLLASKGFHPQSAVHWQRVSAQPDTSCGVALGRGERVIVPDVEEDGGMAGTQGLQHYRLSGLRSVQSTPLVARDGRVLGMLSTHWRVPHTPAARDLATLDLLARQAAHVLERRAATRGGS